MPRQPARAQTWTVVAPRTPRVRCQGPAIALNLALQKKGRLLKSASASDEYIRGGCGAVQSRQPLAKLLCPRKQRTKAETRHHSRGWKAANGSSASAGSPAIGVVSTAGMSSRSCRDNAANAASEAVREDGITVEALGRNDSP